MRIRLPHPREGPRLRFYGVWDEVGRQKVDGSRTRKRKDGLSRDRLLALRQSQFHYPAETNDRQAFFGRRVTLRRLGDIVQLRNENRVAWAGSGSCSIFVTNSAWRPRLLALAVEFARKLRERSRLQKES